MLWTTPIWLLGLLPWAAATVLLLMARRPRRDIPFLPLWKIEMPREAQRRRFALPPIAILLGLLAALLAILAAAGPALRSPGSGLAIVVDAGATLSARGEMRERFAETLHAIAAELQARSGGALPIRLVCIPTAAGGERRVTAAELERAIDQIHPTAAATVGDVALGARQAMLSGDEPVLVVSDRPLELPADRVLQVAPDRPLRDIGITHFAVRKSPRPQAMVRIAAVGAVSTAKSITLRIGSGGKNTDTSVDLPAPGATRDFFITLPAAGSTATAELLDLRDDFAGNDRADLVAEADWPLIEPQTPVGELSRLLSLYAAGRPAGESSVHVRLVAAESQLRASAGIILPSAGSLTAPMHPVTVANHPITAAVSDWTKLEIPAVAERALPEGSWTVLLSDAQGPLLAARELGAEPGGGRPVRQLWTAIGVDGWANRPEYVVFWSAAFDWIGRADAGGDRLAMSPLTELSPLWQWVEGSPAPGGAVLWPGIYERSGDAARRAFGPAAAMSPTLQLTAAERSARIAETLRRGEHHAPLAPWLLIAAVLLVLVAAVLWPRAREGERRRL